MGIAGLFKFVLIALAVWLLYRGVKSIMGGGGQKRTRFQDREGGEVLDVMVQDPQCGTYLPQEQALKAWAFGQENYFCSEKCRDEYLRGPKPSKEEKVKAKKQ